MPLTIPDKVKVEPKGNGVVVTGPLGTMTQKLPSGISVKVQGASASVETAADDKENGGPEEG